MDNVTNGQTQTPDAAAVTPVVPAVPAVPVTPVVPAVPAVPVTPVVPEQEAVVVPEQLSGEEIQRRIDLMYSKLEDARPASVSTPAVPSDDEPVAVTKEEIKKMLDVRDADVTFKVAERQVFTKHPTALNTDGSFNMSDPFLVEYIKVGREKPYLLDQPDGPAVAEAIVEKRLGISYKKGRVDEANQVQSTVDGTPASSTTASPNTLPVNRGTLVDVEKRIAHKQGISEAEYLKHKGSNKIVQKNWGA